MAALTDDRSLDQVNAGVASMVQAGVAASVTLYQGAFAAPLTASGYLTNGGGVASTNPVMGVASARADNSSGSNGDISCNLAQGVFRRANSSGAALTQAHFGKPCYAEDNQTVRNAGGATYPLAGVFLGLDQDGYALVLVSAAINYLLDQGDLETALASILDSEGAAMIGIEDDGSFTSKADVEEALQEIYQDLLSAKHTIDIPLDGSWYEIDGTALAAFADGASTTPGLALDNSEGAGVRWNNHATPDPICKQIPIPYDLDDSANVTLEVICWKSGNTGADATTFDVGVFNNIVGALHDADADYGGTSAAITGDAAAKTIQASALTLLAANLPDPDAAHAGITVTLQPTDGTIDTDDVTVASLRLTYTRKLRTS